MTTKSDHVGASPDENWRASAHLVGWTLRRHIIPFTIAAALAALIWMAPQDLEAEGRIVLIVLSSAIIGWTMTEIGDTSVAVAAAVAMVLLGAIKSNDVYKSLGHELIWLLIAAFVLAAVIRSAGLIDPLLKIASGRTVSVSRLFYGLTAVIAATSLFIPSTSARAALFLPVFISLADEIRSPPIIRALALLFPTVILLSASGSLIGAGAHIIASEVIDQKADRSISYLEWMALMMPIALLSSFAATTIVLLSFLPRKLRAHRIQLARRADMQRDNRKTAMLVTLAMTMTLWVTQPLHGLGMGITGLAGACVMLQLAKPILKAKDAFKSVEIELVVFVALAFVMADAMIETDVDEWLADIFKNFVPGLGRIHTGFVVAVVILVALVSHLLITSRTARAAVLIPSLVIPLGELGADITILVLATIVGTGLCQTMSVSSKPVAIFANASIETYSSTDLLKLSAMLFPVMFALILFFALFVWPWQ